MSFLFFPHVLHLFSFFLAEVFLSIMRSDILCLKDTGTRPRASAGPAQPFNWNRKRTFFWHKSPYVGFVAIKLTRKASEPDKKGLGEMYCWDIMLSVTWQLVEELVKAWPVLDWSGRRTNQWLMEWSKATLKTQFHNKSCGTLWTLVQLSSTSGTVKYIAHLQSHTALRNSRVELHYMKLPTVKAVKVVY